MTPHEAVREDTATEVAPELLLDVPRQGCRVGVAGVSEKGLEVIPDHRVGHGLGRAARSIGGREGGQDGARPMPIACRGQRAGIPRLPSLDPCPGPARSLSRDTKSNPGPTAACPGSMRPRAQVARSRSTRQAHRLAPSVAQDVSPRLQAVSPLIQDVPSTGQQPDPHDPVTRLVKECDPPPSTERLDLHDHQVPDLQDKDSSRAVTRSIVSSGLTAIASPRDPDRAPHGPVPSDRAVRPAPRTDLDRRTRNPAFSMHGTRPVRPARASCPLAGTPCTSGEAPCTNGQAPCVLGETLSRPDKRLVATEVIGHKCPRSLRGHFPGARQLRAFFRPPRSPRGRRPRSVPTPSTPAPHGPQIAVRQEASPPSTTGARATPIARDERRRSRSSFYVTVQPGTIFPRPVRQKKTPRAHRAPLSRVYTPP